MTPIDDLDDAPEPSPEPAHRLLNALEDHFAQTGEWYFCFAVIRLKLALGLSIYRRGWL